MKLVFLTVTKPIANNHTTHMRFFCLLNDIENHKIDRRRKFDWRHQPTVPKNTIFFVKNVGNKAYVGVLDQPDALMELHDAKDMVLNAKEIKPTVSMLIDASGLTPRTILNRLIKQNYVTPQDIFKILNQS